MPGLTPYGLDHCTISRNASWGNGGGGTCYSTLSACELSENWSAGYAGGSFVDTLTNCILAGNTANMAGGGASGSTLVNCTLARNSAGTDGGGANGSTLINCVLWTNTASKGGGAYGGTMYQCTLVGNHATSRGGGCYGSTFYNCIVFFNTATFGGSNHENSVIAYSCVAPATNGAGNIDANPRFVDLSTTNLRLSADSFCIDRGNNAYAQGPIDLDGNPRIAYGAVDMGAYESQSPAGYWLWASQIYNGQTNPADFATWDGFPNLLKYATGSSTTVPDLAALLTCSPTSNGPLAVKFNHNTNALDVTMVAEASGCVTDGTTWVGIATNRFGSWGGATNVIETGTSVVVLVEDASSAATSQFVRLRVSKP